MKPQSKNRKMPDEKFIGIGLVFGVIFGAVIDNVALGITLGLPVGVALGYLANHRKKAKKIDSGDS